MDSDIIFRIKAYLAQNFFRLVPIAALVCFLGVFVYAVQIDKNSKPPENLRFPDIAVTAKPVVKGDTAEQGRLALQHMGSPEVAARLSAIVAEALSFNKDNYKTNSVSMERNFTPAGYKQYMDFLKSSAFDTTLAAQDLQSGAYVEGVPLEINRGVFGSVFKWVFEVPVTVSFIQRDAETYRDNATVPQNRRFLLRAQFTRVESPADPEAIKIEIWQVLPPRRVN